jgi:hypothetical protein
VHDLPERVASAQWPRQALRSFTGYRTRTDRGPR